MNNNNNNITVHDFLRDLVAKANRFAEAYHEEGKRHPKLYPVEMRLEDWLEEYLVYLELGGRLYNAVGDDE